MLSIRHTCLLVALLAALGVAGCQKKDPAVEAAKGMSSATDQTQQAKVAAPTGDVVPKATDSAAPAEGMPGADKTGQGKAPAEVGTAASGAPPYTLNSAPEGNPAPQKGEPPKK